MILEKDAGFIRALGRLGHAVTHPMRSAGSAVGKIRAGHENLASRARQAIRRAKAEYRRGIESAGDRGASRRTMNVETSKAVKEHNENLERKSALLKKLKYGAIGAGGAAAAIGGAALANKAVNDRRKREQEQAYY